MKDIDGRIARTNEDLSELDYEIIYTPATQNEIADLMSRFPGSEILNEVEYYDPLQLPKGLYKIVNTPGGGDSLFESLLTGLKELSKEGWRGKLPTTALEMRKEVVDEALKHPEKMGLSKRNLKYLNAMARPGVAPFQEILAVASKVYQVNICVHFGANQPLIYSSLYPRGENSNKNVHLQCLGGVHYNWILERPDYQVAVQVDQLDDENCLQDMDMEIVQDAHRVFLGAPGHQFQDCTHARLGPMILNTVAFGKNFCGLLDSGSQVSLVDEDVLKQLELENRDIQRFESRYEIRGLGKGIVHTVTEVKMKLAIGNLDKEVEHSFVVLSHGQMPFCFILGIDICKKLDLVIDINNSVVLKGKKKIARLTKETGIMVGHFQGYIEVERRDDQEILCDDDVSDMQELCPILLLLKKYLMNQIGISEWPSVLGDFKRYASNLVVIMDTIYYSKNSKNGECCYVPVASLHGMIGLTLIIHNVFGHPGKHKLMETMKNLIFHPQLSSVAIDVATTCERCQKWKIQRPTVRPPLLKVDAGEPFELIAGDCVSLPRISHGHIGAILLVDHKSKFLYAAPLKNKSSSHVSEVVESKLLPMMIKRPMRCLTDNGGEFIGKPFEHMLERNGIDHVLITPHMSSSNGLAERTVETLTEILRVMQSNGQQWDMNLGRALWSYNASMHSALGTSPCQYLVDYGSFQAQNQALGVKEKTFWRKAHSRFQGFERGDKVLKVIERIGRQNVDKVSQMAKGPYVVTEVWSNNVTYVLEGQEEDGKINRIRAHYSQLRRWREPPDYLLAHPLYEILKQESEKVVTQETSEHQSMKRSEIVMIKPKHRKISKRNKPVRSSKQKQDKVTKENIENDSPEEFWIDDELTPSGTPSTGCGKEINLKGSETFIVPEQEQDEAVEE